MKYSEVLHWLYKGVHAHRPDWPTGWFVYYDTTKRRVIRLRADNYGQLDLVQVKFQPPLPEPPDPDPSHLEDQIISDDWLNTSQTWVNPGANARYLDDAWLTRQDIPYEDIAADDWQLITNPNDNYNPQGFTGLIL